MRPAAAVVACLAIAVSSAAGEDDDAFHRPDRAAKPEIPPAETVSFPTEDGVVVTGSWWAAGAETGPALVLVPMEGTTRAAYGDLVPALVEHRVATLAIDLRHAGSARVPGPPAPPPLPPAGSAALHETLHRDVAAAVRFLVETKKRDAARIGVLGAGIGACAALDAARRGAPPVHALMLLSPRFSYPGLATEQHGKELPGPVHVILLATVAEMDEGPRRLLYTWEYARKPPPFTPGLDRAAARRGPIPRIRALADPGASGLRAFGRVPHLAGWVAAWFARLWGTYPRAVLFDGSVDPLGDYGDPAWQEGVPLVAGLGVTGRVLRWGRRVMVGAEVGDDVRHARVRLVLRRGETQLDLGARVEVPSGVVEASPLTLRRDAAPRPSIPIDALALESQPGYEGVAPVKASFEVEVRFPEIEGEGPYELRAALLVEGADEEPIGGPGIADDPATWPVVPDSLAP